MFVLKGKSGKVIGRYATREAAERRVAQLKAGAERLRSFRFASSPTRVYGPLQHEDQIVYDHRTQNPSSRAVKILRYIKNTSATKQLGCILCGAEGPTWAGKYPPTKRSRDWAAAHVQKHLSASGSPSGGFDEHAANELRLYLDNDHALYTRKMNSFIPNVRRKIEQGKYDASLAPKLWIYLVDDAAKKYGKEFGVSFTPATRRAVAADLAKDELQMLMNGEYGPPPALKQKKGRLAHSPADWVNEIQTMLDKAGYAGDLRKHAERLVREGYGPEEIAYRIRTGQIERSLGIQMVKKGYFKMSPRGTARSPWKHSRPNRTG